MRWFKLFAVLTLWASSFVLNEIALRDLKPLAVAASRWLVSAMLILGLVVGRGQWPQLRAGLRRDGPRFALLSLVGVSLLYGLQVVGQARTTAVNAGLLANTVPLFTVLLAAFLLQERLESTRWAGVLLALLGAWIVSAGGLRLQLRADSAVGDLLVLLSALSAALYLVLGKELLNRYSPLVVTAAAATLGAATLVPIALAEKSWTQLTVSALITVIGLGVGPGLLANLWWWETAEWLEASRAALYIYLIPLITMLLAVVFLRERVSMAQLLGTVLVLGGVWVAEQGLGG